ncbi:MAG TPA: Stp1/IreP family PP2C-type Ser/Thr phosphatase [Desulfatiglandales bacterium]|nr:Stp1/IreP family PP2C-type Ser/Thr phosphatase [Desulfatiglandales bacterium]
MPREIFCGKTDIGLRRSNNEDVFVTSPEMGFCLAADGMGGAAAGELASKIFADTTLEVFAGNTDRSEKEILYRVKKAFSFSNEKILEHVTQNPNHKGMGCTAELLAFSDDGFIIGHIGDSRTYRLRKGQLEQLTQDHTLVQEQVEEGLIPRDNVRNHPLRNIILRAVGQDSEFPLDLLRGKILPGDLFLLSSDGLTDMIQDDQIQEILNSDADIHRKVDELIESAKAAGGKDNITAVLVSIA